MQFTIRLFKPADLEAIKRLTVDSFAGVTLEQNVEEALGELGGHDWKWRKARHVDEDVAAAHVGIFVAEYQGRVAGYISTWLSARSFAGKGWGACSSSTRSTTSAARSWPMRPSKRWLRMRLATISTFRADSPKSPARFISPGGCRSCNCGIVR